MKKLLLLVLVAGCGGQITGPEVFETQSFGDPEAGFPNPYERALFMAANRTRSDPSTIKGPQSKIYPAQAPLTLLYDLERSSRFHATMLDKGHAPLMHPSPCTLKSDVAATGCDGDPACGCTTGATCNSCSNCPDGTDVGTRIGYFHPGGRGWGEIIAAGYGDPWKTMDGFVDEPDGNDGHREIVTSGSYGVVGFGHAEGAAGQCYQSFDAGDFSSEKPAFGKIASAAPRPIKGPAGTFRVYATWADKTGGAPATLNAVVDGKCSAMQKELGDPKLNSTWYADVPLSSGCHTVYVVGTATTGETAKYPTSTAFTVPVAGAACADSLPQPAASCNSTPPPPDAGSAPDLGTTPPADMAQPPAPLTVTIDSPRAGSSYSPNTAVPIHVTTSDTAVSAVANWTRFGVTSQYPLQQTSPGIWELALTVGAAGQRSFDVTVTDGDAQTATSSPVTFQVQ